MSQPFKVDPQRLLAHQRRFAVTGATTDQHDRMAYQLLGSLNRRLTQRLIAADDQRVINTVFFDPALCDMRALAAAGTAQIALRRTATGIEPGVNTLLARLP